MSKERFIKKIRDNNKAVSLDLLEDQYEFADIGITTKSKKTSYQYIPVDKIKIPEITIRDVFKKDKDFELLVSSIKDNKILEPLVVYYDEVDDYYHLVIGFRRFWAAKEAEQDYIPCIIEKEKPSDSEILIYELIENLLRKNLNPFEQARGFQVLINEYGFSQARIVEMFGKPKSKVSEILKIDSIPESIKEKVPTSELSMEHLIEVAKQENEGNMVFLANKINTDKLNIKQTRGLSKKLRGKSESETKIVNRIMKDCIRLTEDLEMLINIEPDITQYDELLEVLKNIKSKIDSLIRKYEK